MKRLLLAAAPAVIILAGCASTTAGTGTADAASSSTASSLCTTRTCITHDVQENLVGLVAHDESVVTKTACSPSTVKHNAGDTWTVLCTVTYSDGTKASGWANLLPVSGKITFEPAG